MSVSLALSWRFSITSLSSTSVSDASVTLTFTVSAEPNVIHVVLIDNSRACHVATNTLVIPS